MTSRIVDLSASKRHLLGARDCAACGVPAANAHHVVQKGSPHFGDDVPENLLSICGSGTMRCHGALHGLTYEVKVNKPTPLDGDHLDTSLWITPHGLYQRRDAEWVARRLGRAIAARPAMIRYVLDKLGDSPGREYLRRFYYLEVPSS